MFIEKLEQKMGRDRPIFLSDIFDLFKDYSQAYIYKLIKEGEKTGKLVKFERGIYYLPTKSYFGESLLSPNEVAFEKYISNGDDNYGVLGGLSILNYFGVTTQVPQTITIVTNKEATRGRKVYIGNMPYIVKKSRMEISKKNQAAYTIVQLFYELGKDELLNGRSLENVKKYVKDNSITKEELIDVAMNFPNIVMKKMRANGVFNYVA